MSAWRASVASSARWGNAVNAGVHAIFEGEAMEFGMQFFPDVKTEQTSAARYVDEALRLIKWCDQARKVMPHFALERVR